MPNVPFSFQRPPDSFLPQKDRELLRLELYMAERVNAERTTLGLSTLTSHALLAAVARLHSTEMRDLSYFAHESPTPRFRTPSDRYEYAFGFAPLYLSENVACKFWQGGTSQQPVTPKWMPNWLDTPQRPTQADVEESHIGLLNSPGHRANIVEPTLDLMGIGIVNRGRDLWITQMFSWRQFSPHQ
jgi:uncharacterized protein YkwD